MKHNIEPIINEYFSCYQIILATYASYQKRSYDMMFAESWGFKYEKNEHPFGISLHPGYQNRGNFLLEKFHGIRIKDTQYIVKEKLLEFQSILPHSPIIVYYDVFNCPWNISYRRNHIEHFILITGIDGKSEHLYVLDPYSTKNENIISIDDFAQDNGYIYSSFIKIPLNSFPAEDYHLEIVNSLNHIRDSNFFLNLENFHNDFQIRFEEVILSEYTDIYAVPLIINLRHIANQRYCYCVFLNKMITEKLIDPSILKNMESIGEKYSLLRILLIKQIMKKKNNRECADIINDIIDSEYQAYEKMKAFT